MFGVVFPRKLSSVLSDGGVDGTATTVGAQLAKTTVLRWGADVEGPMRNVATKNYYKLRIVFFSTTIVTNSLLSSGFVEHPQTLPSGSHRSTDKDSKTSTISFLFVTTILNKSGYKVCTKGKLRFGCGSGGSGWIKFSFRPRHF